MTDTKMLFDAGQAHRLAEDEYIARTADQGYADFRVSGIVPSPARPHTVVLEYRRPDERWLNRTPVSCLDLLATADNLPVKPMLGMILRLYLTRRPDGSLGWPVVRAELDGTPVYPPRD
jgi:hypothetical protein